MFPTGRRWRWWCTPAVIVMSGSIGHVPQGTRGPLLTVLLPLGTLVLVLLLLLLTVVVGR